MRYHIGTELIADNGEVVTIRDSHWYPDDNYQARGYEYLLEVTRGVYHHAGTKQWLNSKVVYSTFRPLTPQEKVLYGRR